MQHLYATILKWTPLYSLTSLGPRKHLTLCHGLMLPYVHVYICADRCYFPPHTIFEGTCFLMPESYCYMLYGYLLIALLRKVCVSAPAEPWGRTSVELCRYILSQLLRTAYQVLSVLTRDL